MTSNATFNVRVAKWAFIQNTETIDKTDYAVKMRLYIDVDCFVQVYANAHKQLTSYTFGVQPLPYFRA